MDDLWLKIGFAVMLGLMVVVLFPRAKEMIKNSRKAESGEWMGVIIPIILVALFIVLLVQMV